MSTKALSAAGGFEIFVYKVKIDKNEFFSSNFNNINFMLYYDLLSYKEGKKTSFAPIHLSIACLYFSQQLLKLPSHRPT